VADWVTISSLATAGGTLALAGATYASVRSANRSARVAELALQEQRRPVLVNSRADDRVETVPFTGGHRVSVPGGGAAVEAVDDVVYLALSLRNVGAGIAVLQAWHPRETVLSTGEPPPAVDKFRPLRRDQYIPAGDVGIWQGAIRDSADPLHATLTSAAREGRSFSMYLLYTDQVGGQGTITGFGVLSDGDDGWRGAVGRHWYLDAVAPR
jgi:hypothetical protein